MKKFDSNDNTDLQNWNVLTDELEVEKLIEASREQPQLIYKHSPTCGICAMTKGRIEQSFNNISNKAGMHFVNVIKARPASNAIEEKLQVRHESPQVLVLRNGECIWHTSHYSIKADTILEALKEN
ncbi:MAG TPA: bacillithiol system redox-active protein YtxJ [Balneolaceae bacterium]|nr:bacillithiol system redox-active protein YtxJ [Balneolaceae bacterium]